jgi:uncharacterized glyoxalase superfamily protein PhnB
MASSGTAEFAPMPCMLHVFVNDVDDLHERAVAAGAASIEDPADQFYGDRRAGVEDRWQNRWWIATHLEDVPPAQLTKREREFREARS